MHKSISTPNLGLCAKPSTGNTSSIRKNISTNALSDMASISALDAIIITKAPIHQAYTCINSTTTTFPDTLLTQKADEELLSCLVTPCDPSDLETRNMLSTFNRNYLHLAIEDEEKKERYFTWMRRIKKKSNGISFAN